MEQRQPSILTTNSYHFWWMTFCCCGEDARLILSSRSSIAFRFFHFCVLLIKRFRLLFRDSCWVACGFSSNTSHWCSSPRFFRLARLNDGEDKKRDDTDGERSAQSRCREEAHRHTWKFSAGGPGKLAAQRKAKPANNFGFSPWKSWGHPVERQIWNWQSFRFTPQQWKQFFDGNFLFRKQKENEPLLRSFARIRY